MEEKSYKEALDELKKFVDGRRELTVKAEENIDKYIQDRTLPIEYKDKYVDWQQDLIDLIETQLGQVEELEKLLHSKIHEE
ncbi:MAG: hypothetical protein LBN09_03920 [Clostridioides sp.]|jgi:uncharacterized UPF0160 family protein|nr:hypothetical protein [Clostridioides sp.]